MNHRFGRNLLPLLLFASVLGVTPAAAQGVAFGPQIGYDFDFDGLSLGAQARFGVDLGGYALMFNPSADFYLLDDQFGFNQSLIQVNADLLYMFTAASQGLTPYAGAGLAISRYSIDIDNDLPGFEGDASSTDVGLNLIGGATMNLGGLKPFGQAILTIGDGTRLGVKVGLLFGGPASE